MGKVQTSATAATAAPKTANILRAAALVAKHGIAGQARAIAATGATAASAKRYPNGLGTFGKAFTATTFALTNLGLAAVKANGKIGAKGQATAMGLTALALGNCGGTATGVQVALAILGNATIMGQLVQTKACGTHILPANTTAAQWAQGYVNGLCRPAHGLATRQA